MRHIRPFHPQEGNSHQHAAATVMVVEVDTFRNMPPDHTEQNGALSLIARLLVVVHRQVALIDVPTLDEQQLEVEEVSENSVLVPLAEEQFQV